MIGKRIRMERIMDGDSGKTVIIPMDHGVTLGPVNGLVRLERQFGQSSGEEPTPS